MWLDPDRYTSPQGANYGQYRVAMRSGLLTATIAANSPLWALRWNPSKTNPGANVTYPVCVIRELYAVAQTITAFGSAQEFSISAYVVRTMNTSYSGGTAATLTGDNNQLRTSMGTSMMADMRIGGTTLLGGGGGTNAADSQAFATSGGYLSTTTAPLPLNFSVKQEAGEHPIVLAQNEGLVIQNDIAFGATGTIRLSVMCCWTEAPGF